MAQFEWFTRRIDLRPTWVLDDLGRIPLDADVTLSVVHEYVHYLQLVSSVPGAHLLCDLVSFAVKGALRLTRTPQTNGRVVGYFKILEILRQQPTGAGQANPQIVARATLTKNEAEVLIEPYRVPYVGTKSAWEIDVQHVVRGLYADTVHGIVVPADRAGRLGFRPLSPGMLSEVMARQIDRWVNINAGYGHRWHSAGSPVEVEHYQGLLQVLSQPRFNHSVHAHSIERIAVIISYLALATPEPDSSAHVMLDELAKPGWAGFMVADIADKLRRLLVGNGLLHADPFNEAMDDLMHGDAQVMDRREFYEVYEHMRRIQMAANLVLQVPDHYADESVDWPRVRAWMSRRGLPPVVLNDGTASAVEGIPCEDTVTPLLLEVQRVLL